MSASDEVHRLVSDAVRESHDKFMDRLDTWLANLELKLQSERLSGQLKMTLYDTAEVSNVMSGDASHLMKTISEAPSDACETKQGMSGPLAPVMQEGSVDQPIEVDQGDQGCSPREQQEQPQTRRISENSYDLAKKEASKHEIYKHLHSQTMRSQPKEKSCCERFCPCWQSLQDCVRPIVKSPKFEIFFAIVLVANSLYIGAQLQYLSVSQNPSFEPTFVACHTIFALFFTMECCMMFIGLGLRKYLFSAEWFWGWLDVLVVISAWVELAFDLSNYTNGGSNTGIRIMKVFKFTRLLQGLRSLRIIRFIGGLRILVYSMFDATRSLAWALFLGALVVYVFSLVFSNAAIDYLLSDLEDAKLSRYWSSMDVAMETLYRSILGGLDWGEAADALMPLGIFWVQVFHFYIGFVCLLLLNVMTGVFCNSAIRAAEHDHDIMMQNRHRFRAMATNLFQKMDTTGYGSITISEFEQLFDDEDMQAFLDSIEISASDAWTLFASLDIDGDKVISVEEFTEGCLKLHGPARSVDLYALRQQNLKTRSYLEKIAQTQKRLAAALTMLAPGLSGKTILSV